MGLSEAESAVLSAFCGFVAAIGVTVAIERLGGRIGGVLGSTPTTIIPATWGMWWNLVDATSSDASRRIGVVRFQRAVLAVPPALICTALFLTGWRELPVLIRRRRPNMGLKTLLFVVAFTTLSAWLAGAVAIVFILRALVDSNVEAAAVDNEDGRNPPLAPLILSCAACAIVLGGGLWLSWNGGAAPKGTNRVPIHILLIRGLLAGLSIGICILIASANEFAGGLASMFPIMFFTSMVSVWLAQGEAVTTGAIGPLVAGSSSVSAYAIVAVYLYPTVGPYLGALISYVGAVASVTIPVFRFLMWRRTVWEDENGSNSKENPVPSDESRPEATTMGEVSRVVVEIDDSRSGAIVHDTIPVP
ncbi:hypothetical protein DFJ77DRAFT_479369 [Powellomyces hirtus]|nr:hypothetical protein DFJ77DRAFT_479369 [Powellomyces hirtus]